MKPTTKDAGARLSECLRRTTDECAGEIESAFGLIEKAVNGDGIILACGNGGSAATAQHFVAELVGRYKLERNPLPAIALCADSSIVTAVGNDYGYEQVFARSVRAFRHSAALLVVFTTSGKSENVLEAVRIAGDYNIPVIALTGEAGIRCLVDACVAIPSRETARIQEMHDFIIHVWCETLDLTLKGESS